MAAVRCIFPCLLHFAVVVAALLLLWLVPFAAAAACCGCPLLLRVAVVVAALVPLRLLPFAAAVVCSATDVAAAALGVLHWCLGYRRCCLPLLLLLVAAAFVAFCCCPLVVALSLLQLPALSQQPPPSRSLAPSVCLFRPCRCCCCQLPLLLAILWLAYALAQLPAASTVAFLPLLFSCVAFVAAAASCCICHCLSRWCVLLACRCPLLLWLLPFAAAAVSFVLCTCSKGPAAGPSCLSGHYRKILSKSDPVACIWLSRYTHDWTSLTLPTLKASRTCMLLLYVNITCTVSRAT